MSIQNKLMNATPWDVQLPYEKGVVINIPAFGSAELTMQQMDDYRDGKPGSENVQEVLNYYGLFLLDGDRAYNNQALGALRNCLRAKSERFRGVIKSIEDRNVNLPGGGADLDQQIIQMGFGELKDNIKVLEDQIEHMTKAVSEETAKASAQQFDPERTIIVMSPPTEFPSKETMEFFLNRPENAEIKAKHEEYCKTLEESS